MMSPGTSTPKPTILVVDDQMLIRQIIKGVLQVSGYDVVEAASGEQALDLAGKTDIDGVVLDLKMLGIGGIETCRRLRATERHRVTPILVITAMEQREALSEAFEAGCDDFISKPIEPAVLQTRIKGHLQRAALSKQLERVRRNLNRYVSPRLQQMVVQYSDTGALPPPKRLQVCVLFTDIRGFTQLSQEIEPELLFALLSKHLAYQVDLVYQYGGYVDKYAGDGIMAVFEGPGMTLQGCKCALDIIAHAGDANVNPQEADVAVGCGIHQGPAVIGNIGSPEHLDYSVIGESINLAARLCGFASPRNIVASESIYSTLKDNAQFRFSNERRVDVKGFNRPIVVFDLELRR
jgi:class 3 adenylate cyclase